jgi:hypothetical protein
VISKLVRASTILRHEEPACQASPDQMEPRAGSRLGELSHQNVQVTIQLSLQWRAIPDRSLKCRSVEAQSPPTGLD